MREIKNASPMDMKAESRDKLMNQSSEVSKPERKPINAPRGESTKQHQPLTSSHASKPLLLDHALQSKGHGGHDVFDLSRTPENSEV